MFQMYDVENVGEDQEYNIRNGPIRWQMLTSTKFTLEHFSLALTGFEIFSFQNS